jgi:hypothetical protein
MSEVKRLAGCLLALYLVFAVIGQFVERMGAVKCGCRSDAGASARS